MEGLAAAPENRGEPRAGEACRVCSTPLPANLRCDRCGAAYGEHDRCPHCKTVTDVERHGLVRYRCRVCGGPRVPIDDAETVRTNRERPLLKKAREQQLRGGVWKALTLVFALLTAVSVLSVAGVIAFASPGVFGATLLFALAAMPGLFAAFAWQRGKKSYADLAQQLNQAWLIAASDVIASRGETDAAKLSAILRTTEEHAELLLAELSLQDFMHARVTDDGDLSYLAPSRLRIAATANPPSLESVAELEPSDGAVDRATMNHKQ